MENYLQSYDNLIELEQVLLKQEDNGMKNNNSEAVICQETFQEIIKKAYERGTTESHITVGKLLDDLVGDLKSLITK
jgi:hypothetical protein